MTDFYKNNRKKVLESIEEDRAIVFLFTGEAKIKTCDQFFPFEPNRNFYYMTGIAKPKLIYVAIKDGEKIDETLFIERYDELEAKWNGKVVTKEEAEELSGIENYKFLDEFHKFYSNLMFRSTIDNIYLDLENRYLSTETEALKFAKLLNENYPSIPKRNIYYKIANGRMIKESHEVETLRKAIDITKEGIYNIWKNIKPNMKEYEAEACFDYSIKLNGAKDKAFNTIFASGGNATVLHYSDNDDVIEDGELVLIDLGASYKYYNADISRTFPANGKFTDRQKLFYNIVLEAQRKVIEAIKPDVPYKRLNEIVIEHYQEELYKVGLIKDKEDKKEVAKYYYHGVSHHLGLDTHDVTNGEKDLILKEGMILTVEPGLYIAEENIGIRIEDDILITKDGCENLSSDIIKTIEDIEKFFENR